MSESIEEWNSRIERWKQIHKNKLFYIDVWEKNVPDTKLEWRSGYKKLTKAEKARIEIIKNKEIGKFTFDYTEYLVKKEDFEKARERSKLLGKRQKIEN